MTLMHVEPDLSDDREYCLVEYRHGHGYALLRGFPAVDDDREGGAAVTVMDVFFAGVERISCWKDVGPLRLRRADAVERDLLVGRVGRIRAGSSVFLLESGSLESYVIASRVYWAEFVIPFGAASPLVVEDPEYRASHQPVDGVVRYAD
jgi:hypothetical protein